MRPIGRHVAMLLTFAIGCPATASDYVQQCRPASDRYALEQDTLFDKSDPGRRSIPYETLDETVLTERRGYCIAKGRRYEFQTKTYRQRIRFTDDAQTVELAVACEMATDGLPAAFTCEKEVITRNVTDPAADTASAAKSTASRWNHNGSVLRLETAGASRRFVYERPRGAMLEAGAKPGDPVFDGRRDGRAYIGTAYVYSKACGRTGYPAAGTVAADDRSVVVEGEAPVHAPDCAVRARRRERLEFALIEP